MAVLRSARQRGPRSGSARPTARRGEHGTGWRRRWRAASTAVEEGGPSCLILVGLEAAALKPWINPSRDIRPQPDLDGEQRVGFEPGELPPLLRERGERSLRRAGELAPQLFIRQQAADDPF